MRECLTCKHHSDFWDEIDGKWYDDGCWCNHADAFSENHQENCYKYTDNKQYNCPYWEEY